MCVCLLVPNSEYSNSTSTKTVKPFRSRPFSRINPVSFKKRMLMRRRRRRRRNRGVFSDMRHIGRVQMFSPLSFRSKRISIWMVGIGNGIFLRVRGDCGNPPRSSNIYCSFPSRNTVQVLSQKQKQFHLHFATALSTVCPYFLLISIRISIATCRWQLRMSVYNWKSQLCVVWATQRRRRRRKRRREEGKKDTCSQSEHSSIVLSKWSRAASTEKLKTETETSTWARLTSDNKYLSWWRWREWRIVKSSRVDSSGHVTLLTHTRCASQKSIESWFV